MYMGQTLDLVEVPSIEVPFAIQKASCAEEAQEKHLQWADRHEVFSCEEERRKFSAMDLAGLAALLYPRAASVQDLQLLADWCAWLLLRDDRWDFRHDPEHWEELARRDRAYLALLRSAGTAEASGDISTNKDAAREDGLYGALEDLVYRLDERAGASAIARPMDGRFVSVMKRFFLASVQEADYQHRTEYPTLPDYVETRSATGGLDILTFVQATLDGLRLPAAYLPGGVRREPLFESLTRASENICCWHNDLVSLNKEIASGEVHNLALALLHDEATDCGSLDEAVTVAARMIYEELETFARLESEAACSVGYGADHMRWYTRMLRHRIGGIIVWQEACAARYQQAFASSK